MNTGYQLEVCCDSIGDVVAAASGGADRVELCAALPVGGVTPSRGLVESALKAAKPHGCAVHVLIRPRPGNFVYTPEERAVMLADIRACREMGVDGVVIGALTEDFEIDMATSQALMECASGMSATYSRAFDLVGDPEKALEQVAILGCDRLLTSGTAKTAMEGRDTLRRLVAAAGGRVSIMAASGVSLTNFREIIAATGVREIHGSLRRLMATCAEPLPGLGGDLRQCDPESVKEIKKYLNTLT